VVVESFRAHNTVTTVAARSGAKPQNRWSFQPMW